MKFVIVHFNTPELTTCLCSSINKFHNDAEIIILDNSNQKPFNTASIFNNVKVLDNTKEQLFKYDLEHKIINRNSYNNVMKTNNCASAKHSISIQYLLNTINDDFILLDSDVLLKQNISGIINKNCVCSADVIRNASTLRIAPFIVYFNKNLIKKYNLTFFDNKRMSGLSSPINGSFAAYDTGSSFYEDITKNELPFNEIKYTDYVVHYGRGSWKSSRRTFTYKVTPGTFQEFLLANKSLWA